MSDRVPPTFPANLPCRIALVGEAPGDDEVDAGRPFVGPSGKCLNQMLRTASLDRSAMLVTNVFDEKADDNDVSAWMKDKSQVQSAFERLDAEIARANPTVIVPLGGTALWAFLGIDKITQHRGHAAYATVCARGRKILPTYHPAMILRQWKHMQIVVNDLLKADREASLGPKVYTPTRRIRIDPRITDLLALTPELLKAPLLSLDIETAWGQVTHFGIAWSEEDAVSIPFVDRRSPSNCYFRSAAEEHAVWEWIRMICASPVPKLGQNFGNYDAVYCWGKMGIAIRNYREDTCLLHHALYPELEKSLEFLAAAYSEQGAWKFMARRHSDAVEKRDG